MSLANQAWTLLQNLKIFHDRIWLEEKFNCLKSFFLQFMTSESTYFMTTDARQYSQKIITFFPQVFYTKI